MSSLTRHWDTLLIVACSFLLLASRLGVCPVFQVSEAREGSVVLQIRATGEAILPLRHGEIIPSKPPLFHWFSVVLSSFDPAYQEIGLRLPSMVAAIGIVVLCSTLAGSLFGKSEQLLTAFVLLTTYGFVHLATDGRVDMVFCFFIVAAIVLWIRGAASCMSLGLPLTKMSSFRLLLVAFCAGLAILSKGPLGFALIVLVLAAISFFALGH